MEFVVEHATVRFGGVRAIQDVELRHEAGGVLGLIGPNGAGKTTLLNALSGVRPLTEGTIHIGGVNTTRMRPEQVARLGVARTFQNLQLFGSLSVLDNLLVPRWALRGKRRLRGRAAADRTAALAVLARVGIADVAHSRASSLPYGMQRRVELARALAAEPRLLLLDEPLAGLTHAEGERSVELFGRLAADGMAVVLVEHDVRSVLAVAQRVAVLDGGRLLALGSPDEVVADPAVRRAYLGEVV